MISIFGRSHLRGKYQRNHFAVARGTKSTPEDLEHLWRNENGGFDSVALNHEMSPPQTNRGKIHRITNPLGRRGCCAHRHRFCVHHRRFAWFVMALGSTNEAFLSRYARRGLGMTAPSRLHPHSGTKRASGHQGIFSLGLWTIESMEQP